MVSSVQSDVEKLLMQLYVGPRHVISAQIAVTMAVPIENPADCEVRGVISFLQADEILGYFADEASSRVELFCCTTMHVRILPGRHKPCCVSNSIGTFRASSVHCGPGTVGLFPLRGFIEHSKPNNFLLSDCIEKFPDGNKDNFPYFSLDVQ